MMPMFDPLSMMLLLPAVLLAIYAQSRVQSSFARYSEIYASRGVSAEVVSRRLLDNFGLQNVRIERVRGNLTDHYDPRSKVLRLSDSVSGNSSIAAIGVAAHEVGHAVQDKEGYAPLRFRNSLVPVVTFLGADLGALMGGAIITEGIFNIKGVGGTLYSAIIRGDGPMVVSFTTVLVLVFIISNLLVDLLYAALDPRIRYA